MLLLNIGLESKSLGAIPPAKALAAVKRFFDVHQWSVHFDQDEPCLVVGVMGQPGWRQDVYDLAESLGQDCIAAGFDGLEGFFLGGYLIGPAAEEWGSFNPEYFRMLDGERLSNILAVAA